VVRFIKRELIYRYGLPRKIITDNGTNLNNKMMQEMCVDFKIRQHNSTPYRPKMNRALEPANKNIKKIIQKMTMSYKDWHEMLPFALHGYQTSVRTSTGVTPYSLVYGMEAVLPFEVEVPSQRILAESGLEESEWARTCYDQLNLIEGKRLTAMSHGRLYQQRMKNALYKNVRMRKFHEGDLVLKKMSHAVKDNRGKWALNYEGPFVVKRAFSGGALVLTIMDSEELPSPVNSDVVKRYYAQDLGQLRISLHVILFLCVLLGFPQGFLSAAIFSSQSFKRGEHEIDASVLTLCFKPCAVCDNLSLFAQFMGCPKRLIKTEPDQLSLKRLLHLKKNSCICIHMHIMLSYNRSKIVLDSGQMSGWG